MDASPDVPRSAQDPDASALLDLGEAESGSQVELLARVELFAGLEAGTLRWLTGEMRARSVQAGELVVRQGDSADGLYIIVEGLFGIWITEASSADAVRVRSLGPGEVFGEMALLSRGTRSASVRSESAGSLLYLDQRPFRNLLHREPEVASAIAARLSRWLRAQDQALLAASRHSAIVTEPASSHGLSAREREVLRLLSEGKSNPEIAEMLVLSRFTVNRHISNIFDKIGAANRVEATTYAFRHGFA